MSQSLPSRNYQRGRAFEYEVRKLFEAAGYSVLRGSGSKGSVFGLKTDLIAAKESRGTKRTAHMVICAVQERETMSLLARSC